MIKSQITEFLCRIITIILTLLLCLGTVLPAFATDASNRGNSDLKKTEDLRISKMLIVDKGTPDSEVGFTFKFTKISVESEEVSFDEMPVIQQVTINFTGEEPINNVEGVDTLTKQSDDVLASVNFSKKGIYVYEVEEIKGDSAEYYYSTAKYSITFDVNEKGEKLITLKILNKDSEDQKEGVKVEQIIFTNTYNPEYLDPTIKDNQVLLVSKTVEGDQTDKEQYFEFWIQSYEAVPDNVYMAYVLNSSDDVVTSEDNIVPGYTGSEKLSYDSHELPYIQFKPNIDNKCINAPIYLQDGHRLVFTNLPIDAGYNVSEIENSKFKTSVKVLVNGVEQDALEPENGRIDTGQMIIGKNKNSVAYTNTNTEWIPPTGIKMNKFPFIMILFLTVVSLIGFIVTKSNKKK